MKFVNLLRVMEFVGWWNLLSWKEKSSGSAGIAGIEKGIVACLCKFDENDEGNVVQK